jgi:hypothetical protein
MVEDYGPAGAVDIDDSGTAVGAVNLSYLAVDNIPIYQGMTGK